MYVLSDDVLILIAQFIGIFMFNPEDEVCILPEPVYLVNLAIASHRVHDVVVPVLYTYFHQRRSPVSDGTPVFSFHDPAKTQASSRRKDLPWILPTIWCPLRLGAEA